MKQKKPLRQTYAALLLALVISSTVTPAWLTTDANLKMRDRLTIDKKAPSVSIFNDNKRRAAAAVATVLAILINHMAQVVTNELMAPTAKNIKRSKKQIAKDVALAMVSPRKLAQVGLASLFSVFKKDAARDISSTVAKRLYAWFMANKVFTVLSFAEFVGALYFILNKDGEWVHYSEWKKLAAELESLVALKYPDYFEVDPKTTTLEDARAAKEDLILFAQQTLDVDLTAADGETKFAAALAEFEKLDSQGFCGDKKTPTLAGMRQERVVFARNKLDIPDLAADGAEAQFEAALAEFDALEEEGFTDKTLDERRAAKKKFPADLASAATCFTAEALGEVKTKKDLDALERTRQELEALTQEWRIIAFNAETIEMYLLGLKKLQDKVKQALPDKLEEKLQARREHYAKEAQAKTKEARAALEALTDMSLSSAIEKVIVLMTEADLAATEKNQQFAKEIARLKAQKEKALASEAHAAFGADTPDELLELASLDLSSCTLEDLVEAQKKLDAMTESSLTGHPAYTHTLAAIKKEIEIAQKEIDEERQQIAKARGLLVGAKLSSFNTWTGKKCIVVVTSISETGEYQFESPKTPKKPVSKTGKKLPSAEDRLQTFLRTQFVAQETAKQSWWSGSPIPVQKGILKARITFETGEQEIHDLVLLEPAAGKEEPDMINVPALTSAVVCKETTTEGTICRTWTILINCKGKTRKTLEWIEVE